MLQPLPLSAALAELDIDINYFQCYDGANVMRGNRSGVSRRILDINPRATYIHCQAHQLNLVLVDSCKRNSLASEFFSLLESLYVFMASSIPHSIFMSKQSEHGFKKKFTSNL